MTVNKLLEIVRADIGYKESPANSNMTKYGAWYGLDGQPWCMMAIMYWFDKAGIEMPIRTASCTAFMNAGRKTGRMVTDYQPGDIILFSFDGGTDADHVGVCESYDGSMITTIDGNTSPTNEANGGAVMRRTRPISLVVAAYRPNYQEENKVEEKDNIPADWAKEAVDWAVSEGLMKGDQYGNLKLHETVTREQLCVFLYRAFNG